VDIRELARRSGVSVATVSRALNGRPDVSPRTRDRIVALAAEIGYRPNQQARSLVRRRSDLVGLVWDTGYAAAGGRHPFLADVLVGLKIALTRTSYHLMLIATPAPGTADDQVFVRAARQHNLEGAILMGVDERSPAVARLIGSGQPCIGVDLRLSGPTAGYVTSDNRGGAAAAVAHLHRLGHRRIATITGPMHLMPAVERLAGYRAECARAGLPHRPEYVEHGDFFLDSGRTCMERLLALPEPPSAVFVAGDEMAVGALHAAADAGVRVPADLSVVGYDDIEVAALVRPALTTVAQNGPGLAEAAVADLIALIAAAGTTPSPVPPHAPRLLPTALTVRDSSGPVPRGSGPAPG
jgi:LacI family transcriptional regulator